MKDTLVTDEGNLSIGYIYKHFVELRRIIITNDNISAYNDISIRDFIKHFGNDNYGRFIVPNLKEARM